jgi:hypothetical protein
MFIAISLAGLFEGVPDNAQCRPLHGLIDKSYQW